MKKHSQKNNKNETTKSDDGFYAKIIARQGEGLVEAKNKIKELENRLVQERIDRIEDLKTIKSRATSNSYNNKEVL